MKKLVSVALALCLLAVCMSVGVAEEESAAFTMDIGLSMNENAASIFTGGEEDHAAGVGDLINEAGEGISAAIAKIINNIGINVVSDGVDTEAVLAFGGKPAAQFAILKDGDSMVVYSDLFPSFAIRIDNDSASAVGIPEFKVDEEALEKEVNESFQVVYDKILESISEPVTFNELFFDTLFTTRKTVDISYTDMATLFHDAFLDLMQKEQMSSLLQQLSAVGITISTDDVDQALKNIKESDDIPEINMEVFENDNKDILVQIIAPKTVSTSTSESTGVSGLGFGTATTSSSSSSTETESMAVSSGESMGIAGLLGVSIGVGASSSHSESHTEDMLIQIGTISDSPVMHIEAEGMEMDLKTAGDTIDAVLKTVFQDAPAAVNLTVKKQDNGSEAVFTLTINDTELLSGRCDVREGAELTGSMSIEGKKIVSMNDLMNPESEDYAAFMTDLQTGGTTLLGVLFEAVPEAATLFGTPQQ